MSPTLLRRIAAVLVIVVLGWVGLAWFKRGRTDHASGIVLPPLTEATTDTIRYVGPGDTVILARHGTRWTANGSEAAEPVVQAFFRAISDSSARSEIIAESPASHLRLGVDSAHAKHLVVIGAGMQLLDLHFGSRGPDFEGFYVRQGRDPRVYLLRGTFANLTVQPVDDWRDKVIVAVARDSVSHVEIVRGKVKYQAVRGGASWTLGRAVADSAKVAQLLGNFATLRATGFPRPEQVDSATFSPAEREVRLVSGSSASLAVIQLDSMSWGWMVRTADGTLYKLDQRMVDLITPVPDSLLKH